MKTIHTITVSPDRCYITPHQSRLDYDDEELRTLAQTLKTTGQLQNGVGRQATDGRIEIFNGCRRYLATIKAELTEFEVKLVEATDAEVIKSNLIENMQRVGLKPLEIANAIRRALDLKNEAGNLIYSKAGLAEELGLNPQDLDRYGYLLKAPESLQRKANTGEVEPRLVMIIGSLPPEMQSEAIERIIKKWPKPMTEKEAERWVADNCRRDLRKGSFDKTDDSLVKGLPACAACPSWGGNHPDIGGKNRIHVCLNPVCFIKKQDAAAEILRRHAETQKGVHMMPEAEVRKYFDQNTSSLMPSAPYVDLSARPTEAVLKNPNSEPPKWEAIMEGSGADIHWAIDKDGKQHKLVPLGTALAWARMEGNPHRGIFKQVSVGKVTGKEDESLERKKTIAGNKAEADGVLAASANLLECLSIPWSVKMQMAFLKAEYDNFSKDDFDFVCRVMRPDLKKIADGREELEKLISALERPEQLWGMIGLCKWARSIRVSPLWTLAPETHANQTVLFMAAEFDGKGWKDKLKTLRKDAESAAEKEFKAKLKADEPPAPKGKEILHTCEVCGQGNFTARGLKTHNCERRVAAKDKQEDAPQGGTTTLILSSAKTVKEWAEDRLTPGLQILDEIPPATTPRKAAPENEEIAFKKYMATGSLKEAADAAGVDRETAKNWYKRRKWKEQRLLASTRPGQ